MIFNADNITKIYARFVVITDQLFNSNKLYKIVKKKTSALNHQVKTKIVKTVRNCL